jgi:hypothetical protein
MVTSLFDLLYPIQRTISKLNAKKTQLIGAYKGPVPVFSNDCDVIVKQMGNGSGEGLFLAAGRNPAEVVTVINPTPLDPEMNAEKESLKTTLQELAGAQELSLDMENIRSAATVIALDQLHDQRFQSQLSQIGAHVAEILEMALTFAVSRKEDALPIENVPWEDVDLLLKEAYIEVQVLHNNDPANIPQVPPPDYQQVVVDRAVLGCMQGTLKYEDITDDYTVDPGLFLHTLADKLIRIKSMTGDKVTEVTDRIEHVLLDAFIEDIATGQVLL